jgi:hypothetical protein
MSVLLPLLALSFVPAQTLDVVEDADWPALRAHCQELVKNLEAIGSPLPAATSKELTALLKQKKPEDAARACRAVQKLLDAHCLLGVHVNAESRVKAARGPLEARLTLDKAVFVLVKVHNEGGVTHPLSVDGPQRRKSDKDDDEERWLEAAVMNAKPFANRLSGERVEYRVMKLTARQAGKREATLAFDVGQGSQDLGFRAETPVLFTVRKK